MSKRDPRINPKAGDVLDDEANGARYFIDNAGGGETGINVMEVLFYTRIDRKMWRRFSQKLRPVCLRVVPLRPGAIMHGSKRKSKAIEP